MAHTNPPRGARGITARAQALRDHERGPDVLEEIERLRAIIELGPPPASTAGTSASLGRLTRFNTALKRFRELAPDQQPNAVFDVETLLSQRNRAGGFGLQVIGRNADQERQNILQGVQPGAPGGPAVITPGEVGAPPPGFRAGAGPGLQPLGFNLALAEFRRRENLVGRTGTAPLVASSGLRGFGRNLTTARLIAGGRAGARQKLSPGGTVLG